MSAWSGNQTSAPVQALDHRYSSLPLGYHACIQRSMSVVISILLQSTTWYIGINQHWPRCVLGWVTVLVCQFLLIVLQMRFQTEVPWRCSCGDSINFPLGLVWYNFQFSMSEEQKYSPKSSWSSTEACRLVICVFLVSCRIMKPPIPAEKQTTL